MSYCSNWLLIQQLLQLSLSNSNQWLTVPALSPTECYANVEKDYQLSMSFTNLINSSVSIHRDHKPLETIFKCPLATAPYITHRAWCSLYNIILHDEYCKGSTLQITDTLSRTPLLTTSHKPGQDELVFWDNVHIQQSWTRWLPRYYSSGQIILPSVISTGWPNNKATVPELAQPYSLVCVPWTHHSWWSALQTGLHPCPLSSPWKTTSQTPYSIMPAILCSG